MGVLRNGYFSYRWSQIFEMGSIPSKETVLKAAPVESGANPAYAPPALKEVIATIHSERPAAVFAPHVETSSGILLPDDYISAVAKAVHEVGGLFVLDCIASGCLWVDMTATGVDIIVSAPQKGWSASPSTGLVMLSKDARHRLDETTSTSFACDLKKWVTVMETYEQGGHMYHTTMPTDSIIGFRDVQNETEQYGFERARQDQIALGQSMRQALKARGIKSVAAESFASPTVVVSYTGDPDVKSGAKFAAEGLQIAAGVPLMVDEFTQSADYLSYRIGLFGLDKLGNVKETVHTFLNALDTVVRTGAQPGANAAAIAPQAVASTQTSKL